MPYVTGPSLSIQAFWDSITDAWNEVDGGAAVAGLMKIKPPRSWAAVRVKELLPEFITALEGIMSAKYTATQLEAWDAHFSMAVNDLARARTLTLQERRNLDLDTDQSFHARMALGTGLDEESFLHARAFVVAVGADFAKGFFNNPEGHSLGWSYAPEMIGIGRRLHDKRKETSKPQGVEAAHKPQAAEAIASSIVDVDAEEPETPTDTPLVTPTKSTITETADDNIVKAADNNWTGPGNEAEVEDDGSGW